VRARAAYRRVLDEVATVADVTAARAALQRLGGMASDRGPDEARELESKGKTLRAVGIVFAGVAVGFAVPSVVFFAAGYRDCETCFLGGILLAPALLHLLIGIPLIVIGQSRINEARNLGGLTVAPLPGPHRSGGGALVFTRAF
jgi:hypothetical protein